MALPSASRSAIVETVDTSSLMKNIILEVLGNPLNNDEDLIPIIHTIRRLINPSYPLIFPPSIVEDLNDVDDLIRKEIFIAIFEIFKTTY